MHKLALAGALVLAVSIGVAAIAQPAASSESASSISASSAAASPAAASPESPTPHNKDPRAAPGKGRPPTPIRLNDELIRQAVRETIKESRDAGKGLPSGGVLSAAKGNDKYAAFGRRFGEAEVPGCIGPDPLKHVPTGTVIRSKRMGDWVVGIGGIFAAPFWGYAVLTGKCN